MEQLGVEVRLNTTVTRDYVESHGFDQVIIATGATPFRPDRDLAMEITDDLHVVEAWEVLRNEVKTGNNVVIADWRCDWIGVGLAGKTGQGRLLGEVVCQRRNAGSKSAVVPAHPVGRSAT